MSLIDSVFASIPGPLIDQWGIPGVYIEHSEKQAYNPELGTYENLVDYKTGNPKILSRKTSIRLLPVRLEPEEVKGEIQITDVKILIAALPLGDYYPKISDWLEYDQAGKKRIAKIIMPTTYRGSKPVFHSVIARLG
jgi:hypothetical protein